MQKEIKRKMTYIRQNTLKQDCYRKQRWILYNDEQVIQQEDLTFANIHTPYIRAPKYRKQILRDLVGETDSNTVAVLLRFNIS